MVVAFFGVVFLVVRWVCVEFVGVFCFVLCVGFFWVIFFFWLVGVCFWVYVFQFCLLGCFFWLLCLLFGLWGELLGFWCLLFVCVLGSGACFGGGVWVVFCGGFIWFFLLCVHVFVFLGLGVVFYLWFISVAGC